MKRELGIKKIGELENWLRMKRELGIKKIGELENWRVGKFEN